MPSLYLKNKQNWGLLFWSCGALFNIAGNIVLIPALGIVGAGIATAFSYFVMMTKSRGQTLGKMALGIQVVDSSGNIPTVGTILLREIPCKILSALPLYLGYAWAGWDDKKRSWHDHLSRTFVIKKPRNID